MNTSAFAPAGPLLVVDDDQHIREILSEILEAEGYAVEVCADGAEALERLGRLPAPWLVLLDLALPHVDGWEVLAFLQRARAGAPRPAVMVVSGADVGTRKAAIARGALAVFEKPVALADLLDAIRDAVERTPPEPSPAVTHDPPRSR